MTVGSASVDDASPETGGSFTLSATVSNAGDAEAPATTLRYYRSTDATITTSDTQVVTDAVSGLAASANSGKSAQLTAPSTAGTYYYGACVDAVTDESDTTNNCSASVQVTVSETQQPVQGQPDLVVGTPTVDDNSPETGGSFTLSATVSNAGDAEAPATTLRYYRSTDATITTSDTLVVTDAVSGLAASASSGKSAQLTAPSTAGTYYYGACVDAVTDESDTTNNCSASVQVMVSETQQPVQGQPDLVVGTPTVDDNSPETGGSFTLSATVSNAGDGESAATTLRYYRSTDATITTSDTLVVTDAVSGLAASASSGKSAQLTAPSTAGTYYYGACVDAVTDESDTTNNCSASVQVTVSETQQPVQGQSDLVVGTPTVDDNSPETGGSFTLSATVSNAGDAEAPATTLRYYRSTDATITTSDTQVVTDAVSGLAASANSGKSAQLTAPSTAGTYYYGACVDAVTDESDTTNNCSASVQVTVSETQQPVQGQPDLVVGTPTVDDNSPETGGSFTLSATVSNAGDAEAPATTLRYYRSTDATITTSDTLVVTDAVSGLAASASSGKSAQLTAPSTAGTYYYGACVDAVTDESDTTNNCSASVQVMVSETQQPVQGQPDLVVGTPTVDDNSPETGGSFTLSATVSNAGDGESAATTLRYYRSTDATITTSDTLVVTDAVSGLAASASSGKSAQLTAPSTAGTYYYGACVDAVTDESDTTNNCSASVQVTVSETQQPVQGQSDLVVGTPTVDDNSPETGGSFTLSATVSNAGDAEAPATTLRYYRSTDATITTSDTQVVTDAVSGLAASANSGKSAQLTAPSTAGTYYYGACVDAVTDESDTTNNCSASVQVTVSETQQPVQGQPDLVVGTPTVDDNSPETGGSFTLSATVSNAGDAEAPATTLRYYRSTDATITTSDTSVGTDAVGVLAAAGTSAQSISLTAPSTAGTYYYGACVDAVASESDTANNCSASVQVTVLEMQQPVQGQPDLVVGTPTVDDNSPETGGSFTLSATVSNAGDGESAATTLRYYRSTDATITTSDTSVGTDAVGVLAAAGTSAQSISLTAPSTAGTYYYGACVDAVASESDTANNCSASVQVTVSETQQPVQGQPDLVVGTPTVDDNSPETGGTFTLSATVSNTGDGGSPATTLRYYWSTDQMVTTTHTEVGTDDVGALAATGTSEESISLTARRSMGRYFYGACVDAVANESDTTNNCSAPVTVEVNEPQQPEGLPSVGLSRVSSSVTEGMPARYTVTATPPPTADLVVHLQYVEFARVGDRLIYYNWPPTETTVTITGGSSSTPLTVPTIDDSDADGDSVIHAEVTSGSGYTIDTDPFKRVVYVGVEDDD